MWIIWAILTVVILWLDVYAADFARDFVAPLLTWESSVYGELLAKVDLEKSFLDNLKEIFFPPVFGDEWVDGWEIWEAIRIIWVWVLVLAIIWAWARLVLFGFETEESWKSLKNLMYIWYGAALFFGAIWILDTLLDVWDFDWVVWSFDDGIVNKIENNIVLQVIWFLKAFAFFAAIIMIVYYAYRIMTSLDQEEQVSKARSWILNVIIALVLIKVIDFIYFVVQKWEVEKLLIWWDGSPWFLTWVTTFLSFAFGAIIFFLLIYIWFLYITSAGDEERIKNAKTLLKNVVLVMLVVFLMFLIIYQFFGDISFE